LLGITFIGSGSKGNAALLELGQRLFLLDAGFSCKRIKEFLSQRSLDFSDLSGIFITHEHDDHIKGLRVLLGKNPDLPLYCSRGTLCALKSRGLEPSRQIDLVSGRELEIEGTRCVPFKVPHDATEPMGMRFENGGKIMSIATDLGHITAEVLENMKDADLLCVESNYDEGMLRSSIYPGWLKRRIRSPMGHLPNEGFRGILSRMNRPPQVLALMHLSQESNSPSLVRETVEHFFGLNHERYAETKFSVASQDLPGERLFVETTLPKKLKNKMLLQKTFENLLDGSTG
jgi:phosphoribosyl 1,2-cyclic phosphodiesterase